MASPNVSPHHRRATVCLTCGDKGETVLLIYCRSCRDSAVHHYCLDNYSPDDDNIKWWCWDCGEQDITKAEPSRKSERISFKRQKAQTMRNYWKQKLNQKKKLVQTRKDIHETGRLDIDGHLPSLKENLVDERQIELDMPEKEKPIPEIVSNSAHNESMEIDEPTCTTNSNLPDKQEDNVKSFDETQDIPESGNNEKILLHEDCDSAQNDAKAIGFQVSLLVVDNLPSTSDTLCRQPYLEPDQSLAAEPIIAPIWRGRFKIEEESEICIEILAHLSNKACLKVSDAAATMPQLLDIKLVNKHAALPKMFRAEPPTAACIGLYFFPACERDERVYDSLLDEVIERDLALKVVIDNLELSIFPSSELPLQHWRYNSKLFLWGVFKKMQRSYSSTDSATSRQRNNSSQLLGLSEAIAIGNKQDLVHSQHADHLSSPSQSYQSPVSLKSSQASNIIPSMENTLDSLSFELSMRDKTVGIR